MPKKVKYEDEEEEDELDEEEDELDEDEELEKEELERQKQPVKKRTRTPQVQQTSQPTEPTTKKRYISFAQPSRIGVADAETGEVVGEGETAIFDILANVLERLERIENTQGNMLE